MTNEYEMVTLVDYLNNDNVESLQEKEIADSELKNTY